MCWMPLLMLVRSKVSRELLSGRREAAACVKESQASDSIETRILLRENFKFTFDLLLFVKHEYYESVSVYFEN